LAELEEELGEHHAAGPGGGADLECSVDLARGILRQVGEEVVLELQHSLRAAVEAEPGFRRLDAPARPVEELSSEPLLERPYLEAHRRLRHAEPLGRLRERPPLDNLAEGLQLPRIHKLYLYQPRSVPSKTWPRERPQTRKQKCNEPVTEVQRRCAFSLLIPPPRSGRDQCQTRKFASRGERSRVLRLRLAELEAVAEGVGDVDALDARDRVVGRDGDAGAAQPVGERGQILDDEARMRLAGRGERLL